jgi:CspA family cold shock protein
VTEAPPDKRGGFFIARSLGKREGELQHMAQGTVKWFNNESDYGFVRPDDGGQNVHVRREHVLGDGTESLEKGDRVTYDPSQDAKGLWATNVLKEKKHGYSWRDDCLERPRG